MEQFEKPQWFAIRAPVFSEDQGRQLLQSSVLSETIWADDFLRELVALASPSLFQRLSQAVSKKKSDPELEISLHDLISRMSHRSVPHSCMAGLCVGKIVPDKPDSILFSSLKDFRLAIHDDLKETKTEDRFNPTLSFQDHIATCVTRTQKEKYGFQQFHLSDDLLKKFLKKEPLSQSQKLALRQSGLTLAGLQPQKKWTQSSLSDYLARSPSSSSRKTDCELTPLTVESSLGEKTAQQALRCTSLILDLFFHPPNNYPGTMWLQSFLEHFVARYEYQDVALLDLIHPSSPLFSFLQTSQERPSSIHPDCEQLLSFWVNECLGQKKSALRVEASFLEEIQALKRKILAPPSSFVVIGEKIRLEQSSRYQFKSVVCGNANRIFSRHISVDSTLKKYCQQIADAEMALQPKTLFCEILHETEMSSITSVLPEIGLYQGRLPVSRYGSLSQKTDVPLDDIRVRVRDSQFILLSQKTGQRILPILPSMHNYALDTHPIYAFLAAVENQNQFLSLGWDWGPLKNLPFLPRVEYGNAILTPARWRLSQAHLESLTKADQPSFARWKSDGIPASFYLITAVGEKCYYNLEWPHSLKAFLFEAKKRKSLKIEEAFEPDGVAGPDGKYRHDIVIPFVAKPDSRQPSQKNLIPHPPRNKEAFLFPPGSEWTYARIYLRKELRGLFLEESLSPFLSKLRGEWFFLPYQDPDFHFRLRIKGSEGKRLPALLKQLWKKGQIERFDLGTYRREFERYGGILGCEIFETLSAIDSRILFECRRLRSKSSLSEKDFALWLSHFSAQSYLESLGPDFAENLLNQKRKHDPGSSSEISRIYKQMHLGKNKKDLTPILQALKKLMQKRGEAQAKLIQKLKKEIAGQKISVSLFEFGRALIHLSLVRIDLDCAKNFETSAVITVCEVFLRQKEEQ